MDTSFLSSNWTTRLVEDDRHDVNDANLKYQSDTNSKNGKELIWLEVTTEGSGTTWVLNIYMGVLATFLTEGRKKKIGSRLAVRYSGPGWALTVNDT